MTSGDKAGLMAAVMFDSVDDAYSDLLVLGSWFVTFSFVFEGLVIIDLSEFDKFGVTPFRIAVLTVEFHGLFMIAGNKEAIHVDRLMTE